MVILQRYLLSHQRSGGGGGGHKKSEGNKFNPDRAKVTHSVTPTKPNQ